MSTICLMHPRRRPRGWLPTRAALRSSRQLLQDLAGDELMHRIRDVPRVYKVKLDEPSPSTFRRAPREGLTEPEVLRDGLASVRRVVPQDVWLSVGLAVTWRASLALLEHQGRQRHGTYLVVLWMLYCAGSARTSFRNAYVSNTNVLESLCPALKAETCDRTAAFHCPTIVAFGSGLALTRFDAVFSSGGGSILATLERDPCSMRRLTKRKFRWPLLYTSSCGSQVSHRISPRRAGVGQFRIGGPTPS